MGAAPWLQRFTAGLLCDSLGYCDSGRQVPLQPHCSATIVSFYASLEYKFLQPGNGWINGCGSSVSIELKKMVQAENKLHLQIPKASTNEIFL